MSNEFGNLTNDGLEEAEDRLGGNFSVRESGIDLYTITSFYAGDAANSQARSVTVTAKDAQGKEYRETIWVTNRQNQNFYLDKNDKSKKVPLPGFTTIDDICLATTGKPLSEQPSEEKVVNIYDFEAKKEVPTTVKMLVEVLGKQVSLGIMKQLVNKQAKNSAGVYEDTADTREENCIDKVFHHPSNLTIPEAKKGVQTAAFYPAWVEINSGKVRDKRSIKDGSSAQQGKSGRPGSPPQANSAKPTGSLFNN